MSPCKRMADSVKKWYSGGPSLDWQPQHHCLTSNCKQVGPCSLIWQAFQVILMPTQFKIETLKNLKDRRQEEKGITECEMVGWHHRFDGHEFEQAPGVGEGQGSLACCSPWGHRVRHDWATDLNWIEKWVKEVNRFLPPGSVQMANKHTKRCSTSNVIRELQMKTMRFHYTLIRMAKIRNTNIATCWQGCGTTGILIYC